MSQGSEGNAIKRPTLHHANLKTTRLQEMIDWYATVVGMSPTYQFPGGAWLTNDAANHRLALLTSSQLSDDPDKLAHTGIHHTAFEYMTIDDLLDTYTRLKGQGIEPHAPDGNSVELQVDNFGDWDQSSEWMRTSPQFAADPIGTPVDPEQMIAARKAGASFAELHQRAYAGEFKPSAPLDLRFPLTEPRSPV